MSNHKTCSICKYLPDSIDIETLHTEDRLPVQEKQLEIIGGLSSDSSLGQIRKCPSCDTYYVFVYDHDSESGMGPGYTDQSLYRISKEDAKERLSKNIHFNQAYIEKLKTESNLSSTLDTVKKQNMKKIIRYRKETKVIESHIKSMAT